jgi:hypothetical protein
MGMFSWCCMKCGHPALSPEACDQKINDWMSDVVAVCKPGPFASGGIHAGEYDGYGRIGGADLQECGAAGFSLYHRACWELADKPLTFTEQAKSAPDQGCAPTSRTRPLGWQSGRRRCDVRSKPCSVSARVRRKLVDTQQNRD